MDEESQLSSKVTLSERILARSFRNSICALDLRDFSSLLKLVMRWLTNGSIISPSKPLLWEFEGFLGENMCLILSYISYLSRLVVRPT